MLGRVSTLQTLYASNAKLQFYSGSHFHRVKIIQEIKISFTRKYLLRGYILGVLTHTTA